MSKSWVQTAAGVETERQIVRAGLSEQNLPGLAVAVGIGGDIVWADGLGWKLQTVPLAGEPTRMAGYGTKRFHCWHDVVDDVSRTRDCRGRDVEHLVR